MISRNKKIVVCLFCLFLILLLAVVWYYSFNNKIQTIPQSQETAMRDYKNIQWGFSLSYPDDWVLETQKDSVIFSNPNNSLEELNITIASSDAQDIIRRNLNIVGERALTVGGKPATALEIIATDGSKQEIVLVEANQRYYYITGSSKYFESLLGSIKFIRN